MFQAKILAKELLLRLVEPSGDQKAGGSFRQKLNLAIQKKFVSSALNLIFNVQYKIVN